MVKKKDSFKQLYVFVSQVSQSEAMYSNFARGFGDIFSIKDKDLLLILICAVLSFVFLALSFSVSVFFMVLFLAAFVLT